ncbi:epigen [Leptodactylus fuscus]|uniref:epigen n=1 Tax=Leptodactylus fuscus TaxID=238119 RepID=UPI003F4EDE96
MERLILTLVLHIVFSVLTYDVMTVFSEEPSGTTSPYTNRRISESKDSKLHEEGCTEDYASFCIHGQCIVLKSLEEPICRCNSGFTGERCEHVILLASKRKEMEATNIAIGIGIALLISAVIAFIYFYKEKRCKKSAQNHVKCNIEETMP